MPKENQENDGLIVIIDDSRDHGADVIIRRPEFAIKVLRRILKQIRVTLWDNDMGGGWELEGRNLLKQFLADCANAKHWPDIIIVTSNTVAAEDMARTAKSFGYTEVAPLRWRKS